MSCSRRLGGMRVVPAGAEPAAQEHGGAAPHILGPGHQCTTGQSCVTYLVSHGDVLARFMEGFLHFGQQHTIIFIVI